MRILQNAKVKVCTYGLKFVEKIFVGGSRTVEFIRKLLHAE